MDQDAQTFKRAKQQAYRLLSYRSRTARELRERLRQRGHTTAVIDAVLDELEAEGYVNDRKFLCEWARYRLQAKPLGRRRLAWEIQRRGVDREVLDAILNEVFAEFDEVALAEQAARKRLRVKGPLLSARERQQLARYLVGLGFEPETIAAALSRVFPSGIMLDTIEGADSF
jgi:regulatory protein